MPNRFRSTLHEIWYASGQAQILLFGLWSTVVSGLYQLEGNWILLCSAWKLLGFIIASSIVWSKTKCKQYLVLASVFLALIVGAVFTTKAVEITDPDILRGATQSHYFIIVLIVIWGFYLANLMSRQLLEKERRKNA